MKDRIAVLREQYKLVQQSRQALLEYCRSVATADLQQENSSFGRGSMRNLLVHNANTYEFWIGQHALQKDMTYTAYGSVKNIEEVIHLFQAVDLIFEEFFDQLDRSGLQDIQMEIGGKKRTVPAMTLFTHVITHEFHHKGQILSLSRHLGYVPVDTDIMR